VAKRPDLNELDTGVGRTGIVDKMHRMEEMETASRASIWSLHLFAATRVCDSPSEQATPPPLGLGSEMGVLETTGYWFNWL
jgi:hypothetical protein